MTYGFRGFHLDVPRRALRLGEREIPMQPRVFDLLHHLVRHRDRVVSKDELLAAVWPDVVVSDGSLKRAVSLARAALREGGAEDAIRTYARQGYRFDVDEVVEQSDAAVPSVATPTLDAAHEALAARDWSRAAARFQEADAREGLDAPDLEAWGDADLYDGRGLDAVLRFERALVAYSARGDRAAAGRAALRIALVHLDRGDLGVSRGWLRRADALLRGQEESRDAGVLAWIRCRVALFEGDVPEAERLAVRCRDLGVRLGDQDLVALGTSEIGLAMVTRGDPAQGFALHDEAAATVLSGPVSPWAGGFVYCALLSTCRHYGDWRRASEWSRSFTRWCEQTALASFPGTCRLHRAEVLHVRGELERARDEAQGACEELPRLAPWAAGDAWRVLGDLCMARGELDAAEQAYRRAHELGWAPQPGLALLQVAQGRAGAALRGLEHALEVPSWSNLQRRTRLLSSLVTVALAADQPERAARAHAELEQHVDSSFPSHVASLHEATAVLRRHEGELGAAARELRAAIRAWQAIDAPLHVARLRVELARVLLDEGDPHSAELELFAARSTFARAGADAVVAEIDALTARCG